MRQCEVNCKRLRQSKGGFREAYEQEVAAATSPTPPPVSAVGADSAASMNAAELVARLELQELRHRAQLAEMKLQQKNAEAKLEIDRQVAARLQGQWLGHHRFSSGSGQYLN